MGGEAGRHRNKNKSLLNVGCISSPHRLEVTLKGYIVRKTAEKRVED